MRYRIEFDPKPRVFYIEAETERKAIDLAYIERERATATKVTCDPACLTSTLGDDSQFPRGASAPADSVTARQVTAIELAIAQRKGGGEVYVSALNVLSTTGLERLKAWVQAFET